MIGALYYLNIKEVKMNKKILLPIVSGLLVVSLAGGIAGCASGTTDETDNTDSPGVIWSQQNTGIWVNGSGEVTVSPDVAILTLGVESMGVSIDAAQTQAAQAMNAIINSLKANGVLDKDIKTSSYYIYPVTEWTDNRSTIVGYRVSNQAEVKIRQIAQTGSILDAAVRAGGDDSRVNGLYFSIDDPAAAYEQARALAIQDAKAKAEQMASVAGVSLGKLIYISETSNYIPRWDYAKDAGMASSVPEVTPISSGETTVTVSVQAVYSIK
ncbi:SIMPL domain-containing protein [Dehalococcoides mccartyi]|nr:SIMPL domain-containing protein [Dehalococcoides mccartyi]